MPIPDGQQLQQLAHVRQAILPRGLGDIGFMDKGSDIVERERHGIKAVVIGELCPSAVGPEVDAATGRRQCIQHDCHGLVEDRLLG